MSKSNSGKALGFLRSLPLFLLFGGQMLKLFVGMKRKIGRAKGYFEQGLLEAGMGRREAKEIAERCFDGED